MKLPLRIILSPFWWEVITLTHWGRVTHICVSKLTIIGSDNGLSPGRRQAIIWTNAGILLIRTLGTNFNEISSEIRASSFKKMHFKMSSAKWRPFCLGLNVLTHYGLVTPYDNTRLGQHWLWQWLVAFNVKKWSECKVFIYVLFFSYVICKMTTIFLIPQCVKQVVRISIWVTKTQTMRFIFFILFMVIATTSESSAGRQTETSIPFYLHDLTPIPAWISNYKHYKM